jgi:hypothetical protein
MMIPESYRPWLLLAGFLLILVGGIWVVHTLEAMYP